MSCEKCNDKGWYFVNEWFLGLQGRKDCSCKNHSIVEDLTTTACHYTADGYCLRNEGDYCQDGTCICPHLITEINVIATCVTCETTVEVCEACKKQLTEPKTDC